PALVPYTTLFRSTAAPDLERIGALAVPARHPTALDASNYVAVSRAVVRARRSLVTEVRREPPALRAHVVAPGETLFSIAAHYGVTPQTLAYNNALADTAEVRPGQPLVVPPLDAAIHVLQDGEHVAPGPAPR